MLKLKLYLLYIKSQYFIPGIPAAYQAFFLCASLP